MKDIYNQYKNGEISRKEVYRRASEILELDADKIKDVYVEYFKPSQEDCSEIINDSCSSFENFMQYEEEKFDEFVFFITNNNEEKIREIKKLATTI